MPTSKIECHLVQTGDLNRAMNLSQPCVLHSSCLALENKSKIFAFIHEQLHNGGKKCVNLHSLALRNRNFSPNCIEPNPMIFSKCLRFVYFDHDNPHFGSDQEAI